MLIFIVFFGSCIVFKNKKYSNEKFYLAKLKTKPLFDSLYNLQYPGYKWMFGIIDYDYLRSNPNVIVVNTHLRSNKNYGIVIRVDTNFQILNISNFFEGFDYTEPK